MNNMEFVNNMEFDRTAIIQVQNFYRTFYRFPTFVFVGPLKVYREAIIEIVERYLGGQPFIWHRRGKMLGQLEDALRRIDRANTLPQN